MRVDRLELTNYRGFDHFAMTFDERVTLLIGANGAGKSTILEAMASLLANWTHRISDAFPIDLLPVEAAARRVSVGDSVERVWPLVVDATGAIDGMEWGAKWRANKTTSVSGTDSLGVLAGKRREAVLDPSRANDARLPLIAAIGPFLYTAVPDADDDEWMRSRIATYRYALQGGLPMKALTRWMKWQEESLTQTLGLELETMGDAIAEKLLDGDYPDFATAVRALTGIKRPPALEAISTAARAVLPGAEWVRYHLPTQSLQVKLADGQLLDFDLLSHGMRRICGIAMRLAWMAARLNPMDGADAPQKATGIVLIDELELHLHPTWQRKILPRLTTAFPNLQFIATTHSPQVVASADPEWLRVLTEDGARGVDHVRGRDSNALLREVFGASDRPGWMVDKLVRLEAAIEGGRVDEARALLAEVKADLGENDPTTAGLEWELRDVERYGAVDQ